MLRNVTARLELDIAGRTNMVLSLAVAEGATLLSERLDIRLEGVPLNPNELVDRHGSRLHQLVSGGGRLTIDYAAQVIGQAVSAPVDDLDPIIYLRPSRYCESERCCRPRHPNSGASAVLSCSRPSAPGCTIASITFGDRVVS